MFIQYILLFKGIGFGAGVLFFPSGQLLFSVPFHV